MAFDLTAVVTTTATAAVTAGVVEVTRRLLGRRKPEEPEPGAVSFGDARAGGDITQSGRDVTIHHRGKE